MVHEAAREVQLGEVQLTTETGGGRQDPQQACETSRTQLPAPTSHVAQVSPGYKT